MSEIFNQEEGVTNTTPTDVNVNSEISELVGDDKKFKTISDLVKSFQHKEDHIKKIEQENAAYRESLAKKKETEELLEQLKNERLQASDQNVKGVDSKEVATIVEQLFQERSAKQQQEVNAKTVIEAFKASYGDSAKVEYEKLATDLGMTLKELDRLAYTAPKTVLKLISKSSTSNGGRIESSVNNAGANTQTPVSVKVKGNTTKDLAASIKAARESVLSSYSKEQLYNFGITKEN